ncbi:Gfo/Idh/MocA family oxidoreductase [Gracilibacillus alcaliphilus]
MKFGLVGLGWPGQQHIQAIENHSEIMELTAVCDADESKLNNWSGTYPTFSSINDFFANGEMDAVILAVPHHLHEPLAIQALNNGKHVLVEKPMARTSQECSNMIEAAEANNRTLMIAQNWRYTPWCIAAKKIIQSGELGKIQAVRTEWLLNFRDSFPKGSWIYNGELAGGGAITSLAIHNVDALRFIIGEVTEIFTQALYTDDWSTNKAENWAMCQLKFRNGAIGHLFTGYTPYNPPEHEVLYVYGDQGTLFFGEYQNERGLWICSETRKDKEKYEKVDSNQYAKKLHQHPQTNQILHFYESIKSVKRPETDGIEASKTIRLVEMMYESSNKHKNVNV